MHHRALADHTVSRELSRHESDAVCYSLWPRIPDRPDRWDQFLDPTCLFEHQRLCGTKSATTGRLTDHHRLVYRLDGGNVYWGFGE